MHYKTSDTIRLKLAEKAHELLQQLEDLKTFQFTDDDLYFRVYWRDSLYPKQPHDDACFKTLDESVEWLSKQSHPMGFSGCFMSIGLYIDILDEEVLIESFDAENLLD